MNFLCRRKRVPLPWISSCPKFGNYRTRWMNLNEEKEFCVPETSSGMSHAPSQPSRIPSPRGLISRDSGLPHNTRNSVGTSGNVFEDPPAPEGPSPSFFKTPGIWHYPFTNRDQVKPEIPWDMEKDWDENRRVQQYRILDWPGIMRLGFVSYWRNLILKIVWWERRGTLLSRSCIWENSQTQVTFNVGEVTSRPKCVWVHCSRNSQCHGSTKWRWQNQKTISRHRNQLKGEEILLTLRWLMRWLCLRWEE